MAAGENGHGCAEDGGTLGNAWPGAEFRKGGWNWIGRSCGAGWRIYSGDVGVVGSDAGVGIVGEKGDVDGGGVGGSGGKKGVDTMWWLEVR